MGSMAPNATEQARHELAELRERIEECRRELGIGNDEPARKSAKRTAVWSRRGPRLSRRTRRQAPVA